MKNKIFLFLLTVTLLTACSQGQANSANIPVTATEAAVQTQPTTDSVINVTELPATALPTPMFTPKPALEENAWMQMPAVPSGIGDSMRSVYEKGIALGNDPKHFSIIGDCQNVSSYFLSIYDKPDEFSLGEKYAYLQPTIDYYQGSYSRKSLAVKGGFNVAAILSPLRADPKSCNQGESPLDCELRVWRPSVVFVSMETWWSEKPAQEYDKYMRRVIERILETGAVPIIATKADNLEGDNAINETIARIAYDYD